MSPSFIVSRYFDLISGSMFTIGPDGREMFHTLGLYSRGYIVPDAETATRLRHDVKWTYGITFLGVGIGCGMAAITNGIAIAVAAVTVLVTSVLFMFGRLIFLRRGLERSQHRLTLRGARENQTRRLSERTLWMLVGIGTVMSALLTWIAITGMLFEPVPMAYRVQMGIVALVLAAATVSNTASALKKRQDTAPR